jgi:hypothetical protein
MNVGMTRISSTRVGGSGEYISQCAWYILILSSDTLEQIDVAKLVIEQYPDTFQLATSADEGRNAMKDGKIASWIGVEGGHQLGNSLAVLRRYYDLGVRYVCFVGTCRPVFHRMIHWILSIDTLRLPMHAITHSPTRVESSNHWSHGITD